MARLVYWQHHAKEEQDFDSFDAALSFATYLESYGHGAPESITDGERTVDSDELSRLIYEHERGR